jgi:putative peptidoglycan lipid II flippase
VKVGTFCVVLNLCLNLLFMKPLAHIGPALATSLAAMTNVLLLGAILVRRGQFRPDRLLYRRTAAMIGASILMAIILWLARTWLFPEATLPHMHTAHRFAALAALIAAGMLSYGLAAQLLGAYDLREAARMMRRRRSRPAQSTPPTKA